MQAKANSGFDLDASFGPSRFREAVPGLFPSQPSWDKIPILSILSASRASSHAAGDQVLAQVVDDDRQHHGRAGARATDASTSPVPLLFMPMPNIRAARWRRSAPMSRPRM